MRSWYTYVFKYNVSRKILNSKFWIANKLPKWVIYHSIIRAAVTDEQGNPSEVTALTMMKRFE